MYWYTKLIKKHTPLVKSLFLIKFEIVFVHKHIFEAEKCGLYNNIICIVSF